MITVLQLCEHFGGREASLHGVARGFQWWIPAFDKKRFRVLLCSRKGRDRAAEQMESGGLAPLYLDAGKLSPLNLVRLVRILRQEKVNIIHAHGYGACTWGRLAGLLMKKPVIVHERCNTLKVPLYQRPVEWFLGKFTRYAFAVSESSRQFCIHGRYMAPEVVHVLYNGILMEDVPKASEEWIQSERERQGATPQTAVIGVVGRLESHKGHSDAFKALKALLPSVPNVQMWVVGDGAYADTLHQWVAEHDLGEDVKFLGFRRDARQVIQCFDIQLFPSHMEGTPNTLYEALAVGNAVVASTADGQGEILTDGETALMFESGDTARMCEQLGWVLSDSDLRAQLKRASHALSAHYDGRKTIDAMQDMYESIMVEEDDRAR
ncbi:MAG: glycosyltransferase family 4 protein [Kiritimatiellia bacterium]|jgi:glycosyltransferase involved in cell wall biosynthesis|nr:glycosyltransferase family 4 protein [Kiritimatiellia bacterium]MDP6811424.1 glycosyltransferase family 4 protein [Kiritimatiellia bacterium]MDP7023340.1 glycosyltransferase family 4 protein [Kiritimatiellia bacterium]